MSRDWCPECSILLSGRSFDGRAVVGGLDKKAGWLFCRVSSCLWDRAMGDGYDGETVSLCMRDMLERSMVAV